MSAVLCLKRVEVDGKILRPAALSSPVLGPVLGRERREPYRNYCLGIHEPEPVGGKAAESPVSATRCSDRAYKAGTSSNLRATVMSCSYSPSRVGPLRSAEG